MDLTKLSKILKKKNLRLIDASKLKQQNSFDIKVTIHYCFKVRRKIFNEIILMLCLKLNQQKKC